MEKEQLKECLENGIKMLEQGKEVEKVNNNNPIPAITLHINPIIVSLANNSSFPNIEYILLKNTANIPQRTNAT